jgi:hypothetical protein
MSARPVAAATCAALIAAFASIGIAPAAGPDTSAAGADTSVASVDIARFLEFVGGTPPTATERRRIIAEVEAAQSSDPVALQQSEEKLHALLASLPNAQAWERADRRVTLRLAMELLPASEPARQIVDAHDPVVVFDRAHRLLVTEGTLAAWQRAGEWIARLLSVSAPGADFIAKQRVDLKASFAGLPDSERAAVANVERDYPVMVNMLEHATPAQRAAYIASARPEAMHLDAVHFGRRLADEMAQSYDLALKQKIIEDGILLNAGLGYNMLYRQGYANKAERENPP